MTRPLHELDPTSRFSNRGDAYAKYRPSYPPDAIDAITGATGMSSSRCSIADVGAGTGISSRLLADRGLHVIAIEPNAGMRASAQPHPLVEWREGSAEHTNLPDHSVDLVLCAQAFHWFDQPRAFAEFHRILRPAGLLCLMWNDRDNTDPLTAEYGRLILEASDNHPAALDRSECGESIFNTPLFTDARKQTFGYEQPMTRDALIGRALSASYVPQSGAKHDALVAALTSAHTRHADTRGLVTMKYRTRLYTAARATILSS